MNSKYIAAIEIGSSKIKGIVSAIDSDSRMKVLAVEESDSGDNVRYGRVQNAREVSTIVNDIIRRLENNPQVAPGNISTVFVANGGRSLFSMSTDAFINLGGEEEITHHTLERLNKEARFNLATERDILALAPKRFFVDNAEAKRIVGMSGTSVRGEYTAITISPANRRALERVAIESHGNEIERDYVTRLLAQTEMALSDSDRQVGSLFIDFGAETTSVAAFKDGSLVFAATLPCGSANITRDLSTALSVTMEKADNIKRIKGRAVANRTKYEAPDAETLEIVNYVSTRAGEIIANIINLLDLAEFRSADFPGGIVIAGGGTGLKGFPEMVETIIKLPVRQAEVDPRISSASQQIELPDHFDVISLARYAAIHSDIDCLSFPENIEETVDPRNPQRHSHYETRQTVESPYFTSTPPNRRPELRDDDPRLLDDDPEPDQPDNINHDLNELPQSDGNPGTTRKSLMDTIKKLKKLMNPPISTIDADDMD